MDPSRNMSKYRTMLNTYLAQPPVVCHFMSLLDHYFMSRTCNNVNSFDPGYNPEIFDLAQSLIFEKTELSRGF